MVSTLISEANASILRQIRIWWRVAFAPKDNAESPNATGQNATGQNAIGPNAIGQSEAISVRGFGGRVELTETMVHLDRRGPMAWVFWALSLSGPPFETYLPLSGLHGFRIERPFLLPSYVVFEADGMMSLDGSWSGQALGPTALPIGFDSRGMAEFLGHLEHRISHLRAYHTPPLAP